MLMESRLVPDPPCRLFTSSCVDHSYNTQPRRLPPCAPPHPQGLFYFLGTRPSPVSGLLDFFVLGPATKAASEKLRAKDFVLRDK